MEFSDTIVAASIGATATVLTASFQLLSALRSKNKLELRPKRGRTLRSIVSIIALMVASAVGGFMYSEFRQQNASLDMRSMREELNAKLQTLAATTARLAERGNAVDQLQQASIAPAVQTVNPGGDMPSSVESTIYVPGCQPGAACDEAHAQRLSLCGSIPGTAKVGKMDFFLAAASEQDGSTASNPGFKQVDADQDAGGAKFSGLPAEHKQDETHKTVCVNLIHWSEQPHLARVVLHVDLTPENHTEPVSTAPTTVATTQSLELGVTASR